MTFPAPNQYGVYPHECAELIHSPGWSPRYGAEIAVLQTETGWIYAIDWNLATGGAGGPLSERCQRFDRRYDAIQDAAARLECTMRSIANSDLNGKGERELANRVARWASRLSDLCNQGALAL